MENKKSDQEVTYITKHTEIYKCMVCGKMYKTSEPIPEKGFGIADGCCNVESLIALKK